MTTRGFHHLSFTVASVYEAERFFTEMFGMHRAGGGIFDFVNLQRTVGFPDAVLKIAYLVFPSSQDNEGGRDVSTRWQRLELIEYIHPTGLPTDTATNRPGNAHLCFEVSDVHATYEKLCKRGVPFKSAPNRILWGVNNGGWSVYCNGPSGIALELLQPPETN